MIAIWSIKESPNGGTLWQMMPWAGPLLIERKEDARLEVEGWTEKPESRVVTITLMVKGQPFVRLCQNRYNLSQIPVIGFADVPPETV